MCPGPAKGKKGGSRDRRCEGARCGWTDSEVLAPAQDTAHIHLPVHATSVLLYCRVHWCTLLSDSAVHLGLVTYKPCCDKVNKASAPISDFRPNLLKVQVFKIISNWKSCKLNYLLRTFFPIWLETVIP